MLKFIIYFIFAIIILIGALNWGSIGVFNVNIIEKLNMPTIERLIYIIVGIAGLYMMFKRTYYLPFLGYCAIPPSVFKDYKQDNYDKEIELKIQDPYVKKVVYWGAMPDEDIQENELKYPKEAYGDYTNYGVSSVNDGIAYLYLQTPTNYKVKKFGFDKKLQKHFHYRYVYDDGLISEIMTHTF